MDSEQLREELTCPITRELLADPVALPCCGKAVGRSALRSALGHRPACPLCRAPLGAGAADAAPRNRVAQALLDATAARGGGGGRTAEERRGSAGDADGRPEPHGGEEEKEEEEEEEDDAPKLAATYCLLPVPGGAAGASPPSSSLRRSLIARLQLRVSRAARVGLRRVLCVLVVDRSGSMSGGPWAQASAALGHVVSMSRASHVAGHVSLGVVAYDSAAEEVDVSDGDLGAARARIAALRAGGGTSFRGAFDKTLEVMRRTVRRAREAIERDGVPDGAVGPMPSTVSIVFMTDGQAWENKDTLAEELRTGISWFRSFCAAAGSGVGVVPEVAVHAVGFSRNCDRDLLQRIREAGTAPGQFRYCEPGDSEDALCGRITGMFEAIAAHGGCDVTVERLLPPGCPGTGAAPTGAAPALAAAGQNEAVDADAGDDGATAPQQQPAWEFLGQDGEVLPREKSGRVTVQLRTKPDGVGTAVAWVSINASSQGASSGLVLPVAVTCNAEDRAGDDDGAEQSEVAAPVGPPPDWTVAATEDPSFASVDALKRAWIGVRIHVLAEDALALLDAATTTAAAAPRRSAPLPPEAVRLGGAFLEHRLRAVSTVGSDAHDRVPALTEQLRGLARWGLPGAGDVSVGRLRDLSSASAFSSSRAAVAPPPPSAPPRRSAQTGSVSEGAAASMPSAAAAGSQTAREPPVHYEGNNGLMKRNDLQSAIMDWGQRRGADKMVAAFLDAAAVTETDKLGNTAIHLAAYYGQDDAIPALVEAAPSFNLDTPNDEGETPVTIAIKRRGYHRTVELLQALGGSVPEERAQGLIRFCLTNNFPRSAAFLKQRAEEGALGPAEGACTGPGASQWSLQSGADLPPLVFDGSVRHAAAAKSRLRTALAQGRPVDWTSLVRTALRLTDSDLLEQGLACIEADDIDPAWVFADCFPRRADAPDTPAFLKLLEAILDFAPDGRFLDAVQPESGDTLLHRAVAAGSLPHVELLVSRGLPPDAPNATGNSPVHVACLKRYPCILDFLITTGADFNARNLKGVTPTAISVQMGSLRMVETLVAAGAALDGPHVVTDRGENLLHVAVRNNQPEILALLLDRVDPETFVEVDAVGFTPLLAAVEGDRKECLNILLDAAVDYTRHGLPCFFPEGAPQVSERAPKVLPILAWKTPRYSALPGATALHVAVYHSRRLALTALLAQGADPNLPDGQGRTPLHVAAQRGDAAAVDALVANGASPSAVDADGRTPAALGRSHPEVVAALVGPVAGPLRAFAAGEMPAASVEACADVVDRAPTLAAEPGLLDAAAVLDAPLDDLGQTALMVAASHGNAAAAEALVRGGASPTREDARGLSAAAWARMVRSRRLMGALGAAPPLPPPPAAERHAAVAGRWGGADAAAVFLGGRRDASLPGPTRATSLPLRLALVAEAFRKGDGSRAPSPPRSIAALRAAPRTGAVDRVTLAAPGSREQRALEADRWACRIAAAGTVASKTTHRRPKHAFAALLATRHGPLVPELNRFLERAPADPAAVPAAERTVLDFAAALADALDGPASASVGGADPARSGLGEMPPVYAMAPPGLPRSALAVGSAITLGGFASATADRSVALAALDASRGGSGSEFPAGDGIFLVIAAPRSGCVLGSLSSFPEDREVMFPPGTRFRVTRWQGDAQERERGLSPEEVAQAKEGHGSLVVRLEEVVPNS